MPLLCILNWTETKSIDKMSKNEDSSYIGINIEPEVKRSFKQLCEDRGSNMTIELRRYIYSELKKEDK